MEEQLKELNQTMLREHPELEKLRVKMSNYVGSMFFSMIGGAILMMVGSFKEVDVALGIGMVLAVPVTLLLALLQGIRAPFFVVFEKVVPKYLPEMLPHLPEAGWKYYGLPPSRAELLNCGLFTKDERRQSFIKLDHWMEGSWRGRQVRMAKVDMAHPVKKYRVVNQAWKPSLLLWISYPEGPPGTVQVFPRRIVDWGAGDKHTRSIRRGLLRAMPVAGKRFEVNFPGLKARFAVFDAGGLAQGWLNNRANLDRLKRFQQQQPGRLWFMAFKNGQLAILLFDEDLFKTPYQGPLRYANIFNVYRQTMLNALKLLEAFEEEEGLETGH